ncbi:MAG: 4-hydroxybutyrate coenzyme A transferase [Acetobacteraceae bacterium]|nr:4-hydroxybutyrate coenzyme A transferase [Acetobacteraceae bacterium]
MPAAQPALTTPAAFAAALRPGRRLYVAGCAGQPDALLDALAARPEALAGSSIAGVWVPGVLGRDMAALAPGLTVETIFLSPELRAGFAAGRVRHRPLHYSDAYAWLAGPARREVAIFRVAPPRGGLVSLGLAHDFSPALFSSGAELVGVVDPALPFVPDGVVLPADRFSALVEGPSPLPDLPEPPASAAFAAMAAHAASLIRDGDTVQAGIGPAASAVLRALSSHRRLVLHAGLIADAGLDLLRSGAALRATAGVWLGSAARVAELAEEGRIAWRPVGHTHDILRLAAIPNFVAVNSAVEVDLFGQTNSEVIGGRQVSGHGGAADFARGARRSPGGRSLVTLLATGGGGASRIVAALPRATPVAVTRADADAVVTEHGIADLRHADLDTRAERLIAVAAPEHRGRLAEEWAAIRRAM